MQVARPCGVRSQSQSHAHAPRCMHLHTSVSHVGLTAQRDVCACLCVLGGAAGGTGGEDRRVSG